MRLDDVTPELLDRAIEIYRDVAYGAEAPPRLFPADGPPTSLRKRFREEIVETVPGHPCRRYVLRLGNRRYAFMQLVLQEHLLAGEFYFAVDSHDQMMVGTSVPDREEWLALQRFHREIKREIEARFAAAGIDTCARVRERVARGPQGKGGGRGCVLVVDDEEDLAVAVEALLRRAGYSTFAVHDGLRAIAATGEIGPDLVFLDYELPELDGLQVIRELRADPATAGIPILLSSAANVSMADIKKADGFLSKPFPEALLYEMIDRVLKTKSRAASHPVKPGRFE